VAPPAEPAPVPIVSPPTIWLANCHEIATDGACLISSAPATVRVWIDQPSSSRLDVRLDDRPAEATRADVDGGVRLEIQIPASITSLSIEGVDPRWAAPWRVAVRTEASPAPLEAADDGATSDEIERLEALLPGSSDAVRLWALDRLRRLLHERGDLRRAVRACAEVVALARRLKRPLTAARAAHAGVNILVSEFGEIAAARPLLRALDELGLESPEARALAAHSHGLVARAVGDPTRAVESFREAASVASRLGMDRDLISAREALGITYAELGRGQDGVALARQILRDAERPGLPCHLRQSALNNAGWVQLLLWQQAVEHFAPEEFFERALALVEPSGECPNYHEEVNVRINLALTELLSDDPAMALAWIEPVDLVPQGYAPWIQDVKVRAGLALGRDDLVDELVVSPSPELARGERWSAWMRRAQVAERLGMPQAAIDAYQDAESIVAESVTAIGVDLGRELFLSGQQASARGLVRQLVLAGRPEAASCKARLARGRALRLLDRAARLRGASAAARAAWEADVEAVAAIQRRLDAEAAGDWKLLSDERNRVHARRQQERLSASKRLDQAYARLGSASAMEDCAALPTDRAGDVRVMFFPVDVGWLVFVSDATDVVASWVRDPPEGKALDAWSRDVFPTAAVAKIERADRLAVLPTGRSWDVAFHDLPWREGALVDVAPVSYSLDLPGGSRAAGEDVEPRQPRRALVVADPSMNLPLARREADRVTATLQQAQWKVERLDGAGATREAVEAALPNVSLLHYAGHGEHDGATGWDARLLIGEGEGFSVTDILALPTAPPAVVLSGCETGRVSRDTLEGGMNLGRAFVLAGSDWVVVADRTVRDELSSAVGEGLYDALAQTGWDGPSALRKVQLDVRAAHPDWDWAAFRAVVR
jgi:tetratricopeptide (TPR) repeat protein